MYRIKNTVNFVITLTLISFGNIASANPILINLQDNFYADSSVEFQDDGFTAVIREDASLFSVLLSNDPLFFGNPNVIDPERFTTLTFDYNFTEGSLNNDEFRVTLFDSDTFIFLNEFSTDVSSPANELTELTPPFDLSSYGGLVLGIQFELASNDSFLNSTVTISNLRLETVVIPEPSTICSFLLGSLLLLLVKRRVR